MIVFLLAYALLLFSFFLSSFCIILIWDASSEAKPKIDESIVHHSNMEINTKENVV